MLDAGTGMGLPDVDVVTDFELVVVIDDVGDIFHLLTTAVDRCARVFLTLPRLIQLGVRDMK